MTYAPQSHRALFRVADAYAAAETQPVAIINPGDSRSSYTRFRFVAHMLRRFNVPIASLFYTAEDSTSPQMWKDGFAFLPVTLAGITADVAAPGATLSAASGGTGIVNTFPVPIRQSMASTTGTGAQTGRTFLLYTSFGSSMNSSNVDGSTGGNARRGSPYGTTKGVSELEVFRVTDTRLDTAWSAMYAEAGQSTDNLNETNLGAIASFGAPPAAASGLLITTERWTLPANTITAGNGITVRYRFVSEPGTNQGAVVAGARVRFRTNGVTFYPVAQGGWSTSDHMANPADGITNTDAKYTDAGIDQFLSKIATEKIVILRVELGQNSSTGAFDEWNGTTAGRFALNQQNLIRRWLARLAAAGRTVIVEIVPAWFVAGDEPRLTAYRNAAKQIAAANSTYATPWVVYDQISELKAFYAASAGVQGLDNSVGLMPANGGDAVHQNFDRTVTLGNAEWDAIQVAAQRRPSWEVRTPFRDRVKTRGPHYRRFYNRAT
jgi:hypothetical protein